MAGKTIVVLEGDETGQELLDEALRVLAPEVTGLELELPRYDLSLESRRATKNAIVHEAAAAVREAGLGLKAATVTPEGADDVGSPNRILREEIGGRVIVRTGRRIPGIAPFGGVHAPISVVRMAVGDAYGAKEWREGEGEDEAAFRTERIERRICHSVAEFAFRLAEDTGAKVFGGPKYTVSPVYEGMLEGGDGRGRGAAPRRAVRAAADRRDLRAADRLERRPARDPRAEPRRRHPLRPRPAAVRLDRGLGVSGRRLRRRLRADAWCWPRRRTAPRPRWQGKNVANPMAMILAAAAVLAYAGEEAAAGRAGDPGGVPRGRRRRRAHRRPGRRRGHERVHRRGHPPDTPKLEVWESLEAPLAVPSSERVGFAGGFV